MEKTDRELAYLASKKNERAFEEIIRLYGGLIKAIVRRHLCNMVMWQDDCINDILLSVWLNIKSYDPDRSSLKNWIAAVARYRCIDFKRKYIREAAGSLDETIKDKKAELDLMEHEMREEISSLLSQLSPEDRDIFIKRYFRDETIEEISASEGIKPSCIYNRLSRGRKRLRSIFGKER